MAKRRMSEGDVGPLRRMSEGDVGLLRRMSEGDVGLLRRYKLHLIEALSGDADFVLQNCHALSILSQREYNQIKATVIPSHQVRDILDYVMTKDNNHVRSFISLLKEDEMQKTFPKLQFIKDLPLSDDAHTTRRKSRKRKAEMSVEEVPQKLSCKPGTSMVSEKQLMKVARCIGASWREVARVALDLPTNKLEQITEENPHNHSERVFAALRCWRMRERDGATAARLHCLLTQEEGAVEPGSIDFLLEESC